MWKFLIVASCIGGFAAPCAFAWGVMLEKRVQHARTFHEEFAAVANTHYNHPLPPNYRLRAVDALIPSDREEAMK
jgi:hypothetical protein